jgi:hypothetical protein
MGATVGSVIKMLVGTFIYGCIYFLLLSESNIAALLSFIRKYNISEHVLDKLYKILYISKVVMIPTAYLIFFSTLLFIILPWISVVYTAHKSKTKEIDL